TSWCRGRSMDTFFRLCVRAPRMRMASIQLSCPSFTNSQLATIACSAIPRIREYAFMIEAAASADRPQRLRLTSTERKASIMLALLFASHKLGLFLLTHVFAVAAQAIPGGNDATRVGLALGAYGLTQAI